MPSYRQWGRGYRGDAPDENVEPHTHVINDVSGLQAALNAKLPAASSALVPSGGSTGMVLKKNSNTNYDFAWAVETGGGGGGGSVSWGAILGTLSDQSDLGTALAGKAPSSHSHAQSDVTNLTSDLGLKAPLASPSFTGSVTAPTQTQGDGSTKVATTAYVDTGLALKAALASPTFTGTPTLPTGTVATTQSAGDSSTKLATTAFVTTADNLKANLASPTFTGTVTLPTGTVAVTQSASDNSTKLATTAYADTGLALKANLASPTFTGTPSLPTGTTATTQSAGDNSTKLATTAYADTGLALKANLASPTFTGTPTLPTGTVATTQSAGDSSTKLATTAFATTADALKANLAAPTFTGPVQIELASDPELRLRETGANASSKVALISISDTQARLALANGTSGGASLDIDPLPQSGDSGLVRMFRTTSTAGTRALQVLRGDNTTTVDHQLVSGVGATSIIASNGGKLGVGKNSAGVALDVGGTDGVQLPSGTTAQRPTGSNGIIRYNSDLANVDAYVAGAWAPMATQGYVENLGYPGRRTRGYSMFTDFMGNAVNDMKQDASGTGAVGTGFSSTAIGCTTDRPGISTYAAGTTSSGYAGLSSHFGAVLFGGGVWQFEGDFQIEGALNDGSNAYTIRLGFINALPNAAVTNGAYFYYSSASANWFARTVANSVATATDTDTTVVATTNFMRFKIEVNAAGTSVVYSIDGVVKATHSANIPIVAGRETGFAFSILKTLGSTDRRLKVDWLYVDYAATSAIRT